MALETKEKDIDGYAVTVTALAGWRAYRLKHKLFTLFGPVILKGLSGIADSKKGLDLSVIDKQVDIGKFVSALDDLFEKLTEDKYVAITKQILVSTFVNNLDVSDENNFNDVFSQKMDLIYKVMYFTLEVNYGSFLALIGTGQELLKGKLGTKTVSSAN